MKDLIFVTCLYFQILLVECDIFVNNLNSSNAPVKMFIQKTINHLFSENDTLNLILDSDLCEDAIFEMNTTRPYIVLNMDMDVINYVDKFQYDGQFIICPKDVQSLIYQVYNARRIAGNNNRSMGNSKILVITDTLDVQMIFKTCWYYGINNVISLVYWRGISDLFTCNRFAPENVCGKTPKFVIDHDCDQLSLSFTNVIHQMNKCPITFAFERNEMFANERRFPVARAVLHVIRELSYRLNATFGRILMADIDSWFDDLIRNPSVISISWTPFSHVHYFVVTEPLVRTNFVWMVPKAKQISNMNVCMQVFNYDVWIATSIVFISASLIWFLIISRNGGFTFDKLCISFLNVWSLTICGNVAQLPRPTSLALRILLLFYFFYAINMQFAFTSDMSTVLIAPQYDFQIRSLEELADSQLPIYADDSFKWFYFSENSTERKLYTKLKNSMYSVTHEQFKDYLINLRLHGNCAVITSLEDMYNVEILTKKKVEAYEIRDNSMTGLYTYRLRLLSDHFFTSTLNTFISRMIESGIHDKHKNDFYQQGGYFTEKVDTTQEDELTLKHITFIFIFLGIGLCTACVVFCFELVLHKYL